MPGRPAQGAEGLRAGLTSPVQRARKLWAVLGTVLPYNPTVMRPAGSSSIAMSMKQRSVTWWCDASQNLPRAPVREVGGAAHCEVGFDVLALQQEIPLGTLGLLDGARDSASKFLVLLDLPEAVISRCEVPQLPIDLFVLVSTHRKRESRLGGHAGLETRAGIVRKDLGP